MNRPISSNEWRPRKSLGQNFLVDERVARKIVDFADVRPEETVLEIGPGTGALTGLLAERAARVVAVEIDPVVARTLSQRMSAANVVIIERDILRADLVALAAEHGVERWPVVANLPYSISSRLLVHLVEKARVVDRATMMVQREVGERMLAPPGSRTYGLVSVLLQATGTLRRGFRVGPGAFRPRPKIESLVFAWHADPPADLDIPALIATAKAAFSQRRKRIDNALLTLPGADAGRIAAACHAAGVDPGARAEHLAPDAFIRLSRAFIELGVLLPGDL